MKNLQMGAQCVLPAAMPGYVDAQERIIRVAATLAVSIAQRGAAREQALRYFDQVWKSVVLPRLQYRFRFRLSPIDWAHPPDTQ